MNDENPLIHPTITDTLNAVMFIARSLDQIIAALINRDKDMKALFLSELGQYSYHLHNIEEALNHCRNKANGAKITKAANVKNILIGATLKTTLRKMINAIGRLKEIHQDITYREENKAIFSNNEIVTFCKTLKNIQEAGRHCIQAIEG